MHACTHTVHKCAPHFITHALPGGSWDMADVLASRDMCLISLAAGHLPPLRGSTLRSIKHPSCASEPCTHPGCTVPNCKGNCLLWSGGNGGVGATARLIIVHHKTERHRSSQPINALLPSSLVEAISPYVLHGWSQLVRLCSESEQRPQQLLLDDKARPLSASNLPPMWNRLLRRYNNGIFPSYFPITRLRHAFVGDIRSSGKGSLPASATEEGMALIMGNSVQRWDATYDIERKRRLMQQGADGMAAWRADIMCRSGVATCHAAPAGAVPLAAAMPLPPPPPPSPPQQAPEMRGQLAGVRGRGQQAQPFATGGGFCTPQVCTHEGLLCVRCCCLCLWAGKSENEVVTVFCNMFLAVSTMYIRTKHCHCCCSSPPLLLMHTLHFAAPPLLPPPPPALPLPSSYPPHSAH